MSNREETPMSTRHISPSQGSHTSIIYDSFDDPSHPTHAFFVEDNFPKHFIIKHPSKNIVQDYSPLIVERELKNCLGARLFKQVDIRHNAEKGLLYVEVGHRKSAEQLLCTRLLGSIPVNCEINRSMNSCKGVIHYDKSCEDPIDDLLASLSHYGVIDVYPFQKNGKRTGIYSLTFANTLPPMYVKIGYRRCKVYEPNPRQCFKCFGFGHGAKTCRKTAVCSKCSSKEHSFRDCSEPLCCPNCSESHNALEKTCPAYLFEKEVAKHKHISGGSYPNARKHCLRVHPSLVDRVKYLAKQRNAQPENSAQRVKSTGPNIRGNDPGQEIYQQLQATISHQDSIIKTQAATISELQKEIRDLKAQIPSDLQTQLNQMQTMIATLCSKYIGSNCPTQPRETPTNKQPVSQHKENGQSHGVSSARADSRKRKRDPSPNKSLMPPPTVTTHQEQERSSPSLPAPKKVTPSKSQSPKETLMKTSPCKPSPQPNSRASSRDAPSTTDVHRDRSVSPDGARRASPSMRGRSTTPHRGRSTTPHNNNNSANKKFEVQRISIP